MGTGEESAWYVCWVSSKREWWYIQGPLEGALIVVKMLAYSANYGTNGQEDG